MGFPNAQVRLVATTRQASLLTTAAYTLAGFGFLFWILVAHLAKPRAVGLAVTTVSLSGLLSSLSILGTDFGLLRFLPASNNPKMMAQRILWFVLGSSLVFSFGGIAVLAALGSILPTPYLPLLASIAMLTATSTMVDTVFIALRQNQFTFQRALAFSVAKLLLIPFLVGWGGIGIAVSYSLGLGLGILLVLGQVRRSLSNPPSSASEEPNLATIASFSFLNFSSVMGLTVVD